jgi:hypothetical protein
MKMRRNDDGRNSGRHTTSFGGTSPRVFLQKVVRSEMGYMKAWADRPRVEGGGREMREKRVRVMGL